MARLIKGALFDPNKNPNRLYHHKSSFERELMVGAAIEEEVDIFNEDFFEEGTKFVNLSAIEDIIINQYATQGNEQDSHYKQD